MIPWNRPTHFFRSKIVKRIAPRHTIFLLALSWLKHQAIHKTLQHTPLLHMQLVNDSFLFLLVRTFPASPYFHGNPHVSLGSLSIPPLLPPTGVIQWRNFPDQGSGKYMVLVTFGGQKSSEWALGISSGFIIGYVGLHRANLEVQSSLWRSSGVDAPRTPRALSEAGQVNP